jgi:hypothetical protein
MGVPYPAQPDEQPASLEFQGKHICIKGAWNALAHRKKRNLTAIAYTWPALQMAII